MPCKEATELQSPSQPAATQAPRIALVSTPRSGNTWLRHLLSRIYGIPELSTHSPADLDWPTLPEACVLQIHWPPTSPFLTRLEENRFQVVVLARHPLDTLISILQFTLRDPSTIRWLEGEDGSERSIFGAMPCSAPFLEYATGKRTAALLALSREWWQEDCLRVRYEDLVAEPEQELARLTETLGGEIQLPLAEAISRTTIPKLRRQTHCDHHFWQGKPGLWKRLLPEVEARQIASAHEECFSEFGYSCDPDRTLSRGQADACWIKLVWAELAEDLQNLRLLKQKLSESQTHYNLIHEELVATQKERSALAARLQQLGIREDENLGPLAVAVGRRLCAWSARYPRTARLLKWIVRWRNKGMANGGV